MVVQEVLPGRRDADGRLVYGGQEFKRVHREKISTSFALAQDPAGQLLVFAADGAALGMYGDQVRVLEEVYQNYFISSSRQSK